MYGLHHVWWGLFFVPQRVDNTEMRCNHVSMSERMEKSNAELPLEEQVVIAERLSQTTERLNRVDIDDAIVAVGDNPQFREDFEALEKQAAEDRQKLEAGVSNKKVLVERLRDLGREARRKGFEQEALGKEEVAARIERMFGLK
jgi:hypothetical protein